MSTTFPAPGGTPVYLDHAATSPMVPEAAAAWSHWAAQAANPSSLHSAGRAARRALEEARERIAWHLGARPTEVIFTSGGTEADNLAVTGAYSAARASGARRTVVVSAVEHAAVLDPATWLSRNSGADLVVAAVDSDGRLNLAALAETIRERGDDIAVISVMLANNEVGTLQPVAEVAELARRHGIAVHTDAVQAVGAIDVDFAGLGVDAMTISAHKLGGPVGVGALIARRELPLTPVIHGGGQERAVRSGTVDVAGAVAFAAALDVAMQDRAAVAARIATVRDRLIDGVLAAVPGSHLRGVDPRHTADGRLPGNAHFTFDGCEGDSLLYLLDSAGVCASTGSACHAGIPQASHVLVAMGLTEVEARGALRFSLGPASAASDIDRVVDVLPGVVDRARRAGISGVVSSGTGGTTVEGTR